MTSENVLIKDLLEASKLIRDDLLDRAEVEKDGTKVVNVSFGRWLNFKNAITKLENKNN